MHDPEILLAMPGRLDWEKLFGRRAPVELELGFGRARFLIESARAHPERDFLGVERSRKWYREGLERIRQAAPGNLRVCHAEALDFLTRRVPDGSLEALHVYHPDPWPKKRHHKRRLISAGFLDQAARVLAPGGHLRITTDHEAYRAAIARLLAEQSALAGREWDGEDPDTHFAAKYRAAGRAIHRFCAQRRAEP
jgi:tRNA (guanine-N7-)-methyltransferase